MVVAATDQEGRRATVIAAMGPQDQATEQVGVAAPSPGANHRRSIQLGPLRRRGVQLGPLRSSLTQAGPRRSCEGVCQRD